MTATQRINPLRPEEGGRDTGERDGGRHRDRVPDGEECADVDAVGEAEDAVVEEEHGDLDHWNSRGVEDDIGEDDLFFCSYLGHGRRRSMACLTFMLCTTSSGSTTQICFPMPYAPPGILLELVVPVAWFGLYLVCSRPLSHMRKPNHATVSTISSYFLYRVAYQSHQKRPIVVF